MATGTLARTQAVNRRQCLLYAGGVLTVGLLSGRGLASTNDAVRLSPAQSRVFRSWAARILREQVVRGPTPRWFHRDCAGLVRFAVAEALREHDAKWVKAMGLGGTPLPPDLALSPAQQALRQRWRRADGSTGAYVGALELVQENTRFRGKDINQADILDLLFFDQGDDQHLMVWMGHYLIYHTGTETKTDNGLRAVRLDDLMKWRDTRWRPQPSNPNFAGLYRLAFLS